MVPYLRQTMVMTSLTRDQLGDPRLVRLADTVTGQTQAGIDQRQGWLDQRGLSAHGHSHQQVDTRHQTDRERLTRLGGHALDRAFAQVMTTRARTGSRLAANQARAGGLPEVRQFARQLQIAQQHQLQQLRSWQHTAGNR
jgi:uncharacterized protein (DUF305 family)